MNNSRKTNLSNKPDLIASEIKQEETINFIQKNFVKIILLVLCFIIIAIFFTLYQNNLDAKNENFFTINQEIKAETFASAKLGLEMAEANLEENLPLGFITYFTKAKIHIEELQITEAVKTFYIIAKNHRFPTEARDLALLNIAQLKIEYEDAINNLNKSELQPAPEILTSLISQESAFALLAKEMLAFYYLKKGDENLSKRLFQEIIIDADSTANLRSRTQIILDALFENASSDGINGSNGGDGISGVDGGDGKPSNLEVE